jgi:hypothetical protein
MHLGVIIYGGMTAQIIEEKRIFADPLNWLVE